MKNWMTRSVLALSGLAFLVGLLIITGYILAEKRKGRSVSVEARPFELVDGDAVRARGKYLFASRGCIDCHGHDGAGRMFLDTPDGLKVRGANLTPGAHSAVTGYRPEDWERAIRHGVAPSGRPLLIMPSEDYNRLTDADLAALVAHIRSLPAVAGEPALIDLPLIPTLAYGFGLLRDAAAKIDHALPPEAPVPEGITAEHGRYVANMCVGCHGANLQGGRIPGAPPDWPPAPALRGTDGNALDRYPEAEQFARMFRSGKRVDGSSIQVMPFEALREMSDTDVRALHLYLRGQARAKS